MNGVQDIDWLAITPPLVLSCGAILVLLGDAFLPARNRLQAHVPALVAVAAALGAGVAAARLWDDPRATFCLDPALEEVARCSFVVDRFTLVFWAVTLFGTAVVALLGTVAIADGRTPPGEWNFLLLCSATGALVLAASRDLITLVVALEVVSLPAFAMAGLRHGDRRAAEAALKFFLVSVISTAVMLMGISLVYGATGSVMFADIDQALATLDSDYETVALAATLLTIVGLAFKVAAVPFHMWVPDTYVGAPVAVAAYLSVVSKAAGFAGLMLVLGFALRSYSETWSPIIACRGGTDHDRRQRARAATVARRAAARLVVGGAGRLHPGAVRGASRTARRRRRARRQPRLSRDLRLRQPRRLLRRGAGRHAQRASAPRRLPRSGARRAGSGLGAGVRARGPRRAAAGIVGLMAKVVVFDAAAGPATWLAVVMAVNVAIGLVYYARWLMVLFTPADDEHASRYDVPTAVGIAIGATLVAGLVFSVMPGLDPRQRGARRRLTPLDGRAGKTARSRPRAEAGHDQPAVKDHATCVASNQVKSTTRTVTGNGEYNMGYAAIASPAKAGWYIGQSTLAI